MGKADFLVDIFKKSLDDPTNLWSAKKNRPQGFLYSQIITKPTWMDYK